MPATGQRRRQVDQGASEGEVIAHVGITAGQADLGDVEHEVDAGGGRDPDLTTRDLHRDQAHVGIFDAAFEPCLDNHAPKLFELYAILRQGEGAGDLREKAFAIVGQQIGGGGLAAFQPVGDVGAFGSDELQAVACTVSMV